MSVDYDKTILVRLTDRQCEVLEALTDDAGISHSAYMRTCVFGVRPEFKSCELKTALERIRLDDKNSKMNNTRAVKVTSDQYDILHELVADSGVHSIASYVRTCVFDARPPVKSAALEIRRIRAGRCDRRPMGTTDLRRLGRVIQGANRIRADKRKYSVTLTLVKEDWDYLNNFFNWKGNDA